jgi:hypothetical protein
MQNVAYYGTHHITSHQVDVQMLTVEPTALHATIQAWLAWLLKILSKKNVAATSGVQDKFASSQHVSFLGTYLNMICQMNSN